MIRYRLVLPERLRDGTRPNVLEGYFEEEFIHQKNREGYGVYYFPNGTSERVDKPFLRGADIDAFEWVFVDMDLKDGVYGSKVEFLERLAEFKCLPTLVVDSGHGIHAYWRITDLTRETYIYAQFALINEFKTDESVWTILQLLRAPNTINTKNPDQPILVEIISEFSSENSYEILDFLGSLPEISKDQAEKANRHVAKIEGVESVQINDISSELPEKFLKILEENADIRELFEDPVGASGDRSSADFSLTNRLYSLGFSKYEAVSIISNSLKAKSRSDGMQYALTTVDKVYGDRTERRVQPLSYYNTQDSHKNLGTPVNGSRLWDRLEKPWRTKELLGLVGGSGVGKTSVTLKNFKSMIENNPNRDHIFVLFSLEMSVGEILSRWKTLTGHDPKYLDRLYVVSNEDDTGSPRYLNLQDIYLYCKDIETSTGKKILAIAIDHIDAINTVIDLSVRPNFRADGKICDSRSQGKVSLHKGELLPILRDLCKELDIFIIIQSQTSKERDGGGDIPLGKTATYGTSKMEWYCNYILTIWKPLLRVHDKTDLRLIGWKYGKIREQSHQDDINESVDYLLKFDSATGDYSAIKAQAEKDEILELLEECNSLRRHEREKSFSAYKWSPAEIRGLLKLNKNTNH
jgi:hypothetical protein